MSKGLNAPTINCFFYYTRGKKEHKIRFQSKRKQTEREINNKNLNTKLRANQ